MKQIVKTLSTGGLGDSVLVCLKLNQLVSQKYKDCIVVHKFIESNEKTLELINQFTKSDICPVFDRVQFEFEYDLNYQKSFYEGRWNNYIPLNTSVLGDYPFPVQDNIKIEDKFARIELNEDRDIIYDVCIQSSAGVNSNRKWKFNPTTLTNALRGRGCKVALIGSDENYKDEKDLDNFVNKTTLLESINVVKNSRIYIGLSGFHTYWSLAAGVDNIHFEESDQHNKHYIHHNWNKNRYGIKNGSMMEVVLALRHFGINI